MELFFQDGYQDVDGDGDPDLSPDGVGRNAIESADAPMLFEAVVESKT